MPVDGALFAEFMPTKERGQLMVYLSLFWVLGSCLAAAIGWMLIPSLSCAAALRYAPAFSLSLRSASCLGVPLTATLVDLNTRRWVRLW